jgi:hypothetical protein
METERAVQAQAVNPNAVLEAFADIVVQTCKSPFRREDVTEQEWEQITERLLLMVQTEKAKVHETKT